MNLKPICLVAVLSMTLNICSLSAQEYFQQEVNYKIDVKLNDKTHELSAFETIEYINNSPDDLNFIYFHLWPNAYDNNSTALAKQKFEDGRWRKLFRVEEQRGYIDSIDFNVNGQKVKWEFDKEHIDICKIILNETLKSGSKITISTPFHVKIPKGVTSRLGHIKQSYQITQWYPKPAVYDKYGWHQMPYLDMGEFYSEFGSFDVSITLPKNYVVGATGDLQNQEETEWLNNLAKKTSKITSFDKDDNSFPESSSQLKTIRFKQSKVHDFAWFADKRFHVLKDQVELPTSKRKVTTWAMFTNDDADLWLKSNEYINDALYYYSKWYGDYPYNHCTAVLSAISAGGGMEYPNITVIGSNSNSMGLEVVIMHEVGHNWFYGILGSNERDFVWMDEGINSFSEARYMRTKYNDEDYLYKMLGKEKLTDFFDLNELKYKKFHELIYLLVARQNMDQSASTHSAQFREINYGAIAYMKVSRIFDYLLHYMGEEEFNRAMQSYYEQWKFKHPYPEDIRKIFEEQTEKDLNWIFDDLLKTTKKLDYKINKVKENKVLVSNKDMINSPVSISGVKDNKVIFTDWFDGFDGQKWLTFTQSSGLDKILIDSNEDMLELNRNNNQMRISGLFKKVEPLKITLLGILEDPNRTQLNFVPVMGWNMYNKFMLGAVFYNPILPQKKFEYQIMPMYAFGSNDLAGSIALTYHILPYKSKFQAVNINISALQHAYSQKQGGNFQKFKAEADFHFRKGNERSRIDNHLIIDGILASNPDDILTDVKPGYIQIYNLKYTHNNKRAFNPYRFNVGLEAGNGFVKSTLEANYKIIYLYKKGLNIRLFAGGFLYKKDNLSSLYNFRLSGTTGAEDYTYSETFIGRYENIADKNFFAYQFIPNDGAFTSYSPHGSTNEWLISMNLVSSLPLPDKIPLKFYANLATFGETVAVPGYTNLNQFAWEAGVKLSLGKEVFEIFLPFAMSNDLKNLNNDLTDSYWERIRFSLKLNSMNPFKLVKTLL